MKIDIIIPSCKTEYECRGQLDQIKITRKTKGDIIFTGLKESASKNRNYGLEQSSSDIVIMLDDDIIGFYEGWDLDLIKYLDPIKCRFIAGRLLDTNSQLGPMNGVIRSLDHLDYYKADGNEVPTAVCAFYKEDIRFDENYIGSGFEDTDYCRQIMKKYPESEVRINNICKLIHTHEMKNQSGKYMIHNKEYFCNKWSCEKYRNLK